MKEINGLLVLMALLMLAVPAYAQNPSNTSGSISIRWAEAELLGNDYEIGLDGLDVEGPVPIAEVTLYDRAGRILALNVPVAFGSDFDVILGNYFYTIAFTHFHIDDSNEENAPTEITVVYTLDEYYTPGDPYYTSRAVNPRSS